MNKKIIIAIVAVVLVLAIGLSLFFILRNPAAPETLKLGLGVVVSAEAASATADKNGAGEADVTVAAVLVDKDGKIVKAVIDVMQLALEYTNAGEAVANTEFKSKQ